MSQARFAEVRHPSSSRRRWTRYGVSSPTWTITSGNNVHPKLTFKVLEQSAPARATCRK